MNDRSLRRPSMVTPSSPAGKKPDPGQRADRFGFAHTGCRSGRRDRAGVRDPRLARADLRRRPRAHQEVPRPRHRDRHGQVGPHRPQDLLHAVIDRNAVLLRSSERSQPRRSRHDHRRRRDHGAVLVRRNRRIEEPDRLFAPLPQPADRRHGGSRQHAGPGRRRRAGAAAGARGLPAQPCAHHVVAHATGAGRRDRYRAPRKPRLHRGGFRLAAPRWTTRRAAQVRPRRHAHRERHAARKGRHADVAGHRGDVCQGLRLRRHRRRQGPPARHYHRRRSAAAHARPTCSNPASRT